MSTKKPNTSGETNSIKSTFDRLSVEELVAVVRDLKTQYDTGLLPSEGAAKKLMHRLMNMHGITYPVAYDLVQIEPLKRAAFKWAAV